MDPKTVEKLEGKIEEAIAEIVVKMGLKRLPLLQRAVKFVGKLPGEIEGCPHDDARSPWGIRQAGGVSDFVSDFHLNRL